MRVLAVLCSGQGAQEPGMFDLSAEAPEAQAVLAAAALGPGDASARMMGDVVDRRGIIDVLRPTKADDVATLFHGASLSGEVLAGLDDRLDAPPSSGRHIQKPAQLRSGPSPTQPPGPEDRVHVSALLQARRRRPCGGP